MKQEPKLNIKIIYEYPETKAEVTSLKRNKRLKSIYKKLESKDQLIQNFPIAQYLRKSQNTKKNYVADQQVGLSTTTTTTTTTKKNELMLQKLLQGLSEQTQISFEGKQISFYINKANMYMKCGCYPLSKNILINEKNYKNKEESITILAKNINRPTLNGILLNQFNLDKYGTRKIIKNINQNQKTQKQIKKKGKRKLKKPQQQIQQKDLIDQIFDSKQQYFLQTNQKDQNKQQGKGGRLNQRKINLAILKVHQWIKLQRNKQIKYTLEQAADKVEIPKKSLDRYLKQIKFGYDCKFNFNQYCMRKMGSLFNWNKFHKNRLPYQKGQQKKLIRTIINQIQQQNYEQKQKKQRNKTLSNKTKSIKKKSK